ncbi:hypothetical protein AAY473_008100 [Plecturocebus cupreus]
MGKDFMTKTSKQNKLSSEQTGNLQNRRNFAIYLSDKGLISRIYKELKFKNKKQKNFGIAMHSAPGQVVLEHLQLTGDQGLALSQKHIAVLDASLHGYLAVLTTVHLAGAALEQETLHLLEVFSLQTLHHGVYHLLHLLQFCHNNPAMPHVVPGPTNKAILTR